jgi:hypothetical protein
VHAGQPHLRLAARLAAHPDAQPRALGRGLQDLAAVVAAAQAVGDMALEQLRDEAGGGRVVGTQDYQPVERHLVGEVHEGLAQRRLGAEVVHVLAVDVGDHRGHGEQVAERPVGLVGLGHQHVAMAEPRVGPQRARLAADDHRGIQPRLGEDGGEHRRGAGLAVRAGHRHAVLDPHQLAQHLGAGDHRDVAAAGGQHLGVVRPDGAGDHHHVRIGDVFGGVPLHQAAAEGGQPAGDVALLEVGARHLVAEIQQHLGDAGHAYAADADEMYRDVALSKHERSRLAPRTKALAGDIRRHEPRQPHD